MVNLPSRYADRAGAASATEPRRLALANAPADLARTLYAAPLSMTDLRAELQAALGSTITLDRELGGGGMSRVFVARDLALGREIVVKVLEPALAEGISAERFTREIKLAASLQAPHIVPVLSAGATAGGLPYYTMPFVRGASLRARLAQGAVPHSEALGILRDVARALAYAHGEGVVHRDIKPENVLLSAESAVVADFGIAKALSAARTQESGQTLTAAGISLGTPAYMAPEQATGDVVDPRADLYAWGVMAYELLAGAHPFAAKVTAQQMIAAHLTEAPAPLDRRGVNAALAALVMRCLEKDPARRPVSARELLTALDATTSGGGAVAARSGSRLPMLVGAIAVLAVAAGAIALRGRSPGATAGSEARTLAVLPFGNASGDTAAAFFADGMGDEVAGVLAKVPDLRVISRRSVEAVQAKHMTPREMGEALGVALLLEGTVRRAGEQLRVTAQLINAADGVVRWTQTYNRTRRDVFQVQDDIAQAITHELRLALGGSALASSRAGRAANPAAYDLFLRGKVEFNKATESSERKAIAFFEQALALDSTFARAHAGIALAWGALADAYVAPHEAYPRALAAARRALALDSLLPEALSIEGYASWEATWDTVALARSRRAIELDPNNPDSRWFYAQALCMSNAAKCETALRQLDTALTLDPFVPITPYVRAQNLYFQRRYSEAEAVARRIAAIDSTFFYIDDYGAAALREQGKVAEALAMYRTRSADPHAPIYGLGITYARLGRMDDARRVARAMEAASRRTYIEPVFLAALLFDIGERDAAYSWLERATAKRTIMLLVSAQLPEMAPMLREPRFAALLRDAHRRAEAERGAR